MESGQDQSLGCLLRWGREESGISLNKFARRVGVNSSYISRVETDDVPPSVVLLNLYSEITGLARFYLYWKAGLLTVDLKGDSFELIQDWFNEGQLTLE